jgi:hypothetical protein
VRRYDLVDVKERQLVELTCSVCGRDLMADEMERQEAFHFSQVGGYGSIFGDGAEVYIDICQHCFKERLGEYCTVI